MTIDDIRDDILKCERCSLYKTKKNYVVGSGSTTAKIVFIGEAPGANEDEQGIPFVGRAGKIFEELLLSININRDDVYICNILKCRPPKNRSPLPDEIEKCVGYLDRQIDLIKPNVLCPMGNFAVGYVLRKYGLSDKVVGISKLHGKVFTVKNLFDNIVIIPLYHPAVATYNPYMKDVLKKDIQQLIDYN